MTCRLGVPPTPPVTYSYRPLRKMDTTAFCHDIFQSRLFDFSVRMLTSTLNYSTSKSSACWISTLRYGQVGAAVVSTTTAGCQTKRVARSNSAEDASGDTAGLAWIQTDRPTCRLVQLHVTILKSRADCIYGHLLVACSLLDHTADRRCQLSSQ